MPHLRRFSLATDVFFDTQMPFGDVPRSFFKKTYILPIRLAVQSKNADNFIFFGGNGHAPTLAQTGADLKA